MYIYIHMYSCSYINMHARLSRSCFPSAPSSQGSEALMSVDIPVSTTALVRSSHRYSVPKGLRQLPLLKKSFEARGTDLDRFGVSARCKIDPD